METVENDFVGSMLSDEKVALVEACGMFSSILDLFIWKITFELKAKKIFY